jgi:NAD(P)-dependent dehydrogenase (short-subunit alcohol dehydrogenase family)
MRFHNQTAIVTGGATGIGYATAKRLASEGAKVVIAGRRKDTGLNAEKELRACGLEVKFHTCDVSLEHEVDALIGFTKETYGSLDILVNNASMSNTIEFMSPDTEKWKQVFDVTVNGTYYCSRSAARIMEEQGKGGRIINVSSINGYRAAEGTSHYNAGKGAMDQLTRCMAMELSPLGILVNGVAPGFVDTPMSIVDGENELDSEWFRSIYVERRKIPVQRAGQPEEIANVIAFLASREVSYMCGVIIPVDGGLSITF